MKKILFTLGLFSIVTFSMPALAQQQINNDGATASELQQQSGSENIQQNSGAQQASDVIDNAGAAVVQNAPNQPLDVTGAPANSGTNDDTSPFRWVLIFGLFFLILLSPALVYVKSLQNNGEVTEDILTLKAPKEESKAAKAEDVKTKEEQPAKAENKKTPAKSKAKKKTASKTKRGKKKK